MDDLFNLVTSPWILVRDENCNEETVSIQDLFLKAHQFEAIAGETVTQNFAILRLLEAILSTILYRYDLNGQPQPDVNQKVLLQRWAKLWDNGKFPPEMMEPYLKDHAEEFNLLGDKRFMQSREARKANVYSCKKMIGDLAVSGNKDRLFSFREWDEGEEPTISKAEAARWAQNLILFDDTAVKKSKEYKTVKGKGPDTAPGVGWGGKIAPIYFEGASLFETLMINCVLLKEGAGLWGDMTPYWEVQESIEDSEGMRLERRLIPQPNDFAALLTLPSRRIWLVEAKEKNNEICGFRIISGDVFESENAFCEQFTLWKEKDTEENETISFSPDRHVPNKQLWRSFNKAFQNENDGHLPGIVQWLKRLESEDILSENFRVRIKAPFIQYKKGQPSAVTDLASHSMIIYSQLLNEKNEGYRAAIQDQVDKINRLAGAAEEFARQAAKTTGADEGHAAERISAELYQAVDQPFLEWIAAISPEKTDLGEAVNAWEKTAKSIGRRLVKKELEKYPTANLFGKLIKQESDHTKKKTGKKAKKNEEESDEGENSKVLVSVMTAELKFNRVLNSIYMKEKRGTEDGEEQSE